MQGSEQGMRFPRELYTDQASPHTYNVPTERLLKYSKLLHYVGRVNPVTQEAPLVGRRTNFETIRPARAVTAGVVLPWDQGWSRHQRPKAVDHVDGFWFGFLEDGENDTRNGLRYKTP